MIRVRVVTIAIRPRVRCGMNLLRVLVCCLVLIASGCGDKPDDGEGGNDGEGSTISSGSAPTEATSAATTSADGTTAGIVDTCPSRPGGDWNACFVDGSIDNDLCEFAANGGAGEALCLSPSSGGFNVCGIRDCVDDCDCFAPPATGTAIPVCSEVFGDGGRGCVLYCVNSQICPDGMQCVAGTCYWPN